MESGSVAILVKILSNMYISVLIFPIFLNKKYLKIDMTFGFSGVKKKRGKILQSDLNLHQFKNPEILSMVYMILDTCCVHTYMLLDTYILDTCCVHTCCVLH